MYDIVTPSTMYWERSGQAVRNDMNLEDEAQFLLRQGKVAEAEKLFERLLDTAPDHVQALNAIALSALRNGNGSRALQLIERAVAADPQDPLSAHHLGRIRDTMGDLQGSIAAHRTAVSLRPEFHLSRIYLAEGLERSGDRPRAVVQYARALQDAQAQGRWLNPTTTPEPLRPLIQHAVLAVRTGRRDAFASLFDPLLKRYGSSSLERVQAALAIHLNEAEARPTDPRQKPGFLYFPGLPTMAYFDPKLFDGVAGLERDTAAIRDELNALLPSPSGRERVFDNPDIENVNLRGTDRAPSWNGYYFYRHGERREDNCGRCPVTAAALDRLPLARVRDHGPEVLFSVFTPGTHLLPHRGVTNTRLVGHLPLIVPRDCALNVGGEIHEWQEGRVVVFDDTFEHEAWNRSDQIRVVLIFDIWNPYLNEAERAALTELIGAIGDFRHAVETA
jgi:aspartate beta-hydroxylase